SQPHRGNPTLTSITTSRTPPAAAARTVWCESTATQILAPPATSLPSLRASSTSLASRRSSPSPAATIPSHSRIVAHVNASWPAAACRLARLVHLCALTCGRSRGPGSAAAISAILRSSTSASISSAGVWICEIASWPVTGASAGVSFAQLRSGPDLGPGQHHRIQHPPAPSLAGSVGEPRQGHIRQIAQEVGDLGVGQPHGSHPVGRPVPNRIGRARADVTVEIAEQPGDVGHERLDVLVHGHGRYLVGPDRRREQPQHVGSLHGTPDAAFRDYLEYPR